MNNRNVGFLSGSRGIGFALLQALAHFGKLPQAVTHHGSQSVRSYGKDRNHEPLKKAAGIKRLRRQQRNTLLAEKGAFLDSRITYPFAEPALRGMYGLIGR